MHVRAVSEEPDLVGHAEVFRRPAEAPVAGPVAVYVQRQNGSGALSLQRASLGGRSGSCDFQPAQGDQIGNRTA